MPEIKAAKDCHDPGSPSEGTQRQTLDRSPCERPKDKSEMQDDVQELPQIDPSGRGPDKAEILDPLLVNTGLPMHPAYPPQREPQPGISRQRRCGHVRMRRGPPTRRLSRT